MAAEAMTQESTSADAVRTDDVRSATKELTKRFDRAYFVRCVEEKRLPSELTQALGDSGLLGLGVPEEYGGQGGGVREQVALIETMGRAGLPSFGFLIANFARNIVLHHGSPEQIKRFVPPTMTGRTETCFGLTEPDAGTNTFAMRTKAERTSDGWLINGGKVFISQAGASSQMLLVAKTTEFGEGQSARLSVFITDLPHDGISMEPLRITASAPEQQWSVFFDDVVLPEEALIGEEGCGGQYMFDGLNPERITIGAMSLGLGYFVLEKGASYSRARAPFGRPIGSYQAVAHPLAQSFIELEAARLMVLKAAEDVDLGREAGISSNAAKYLASNAAYQAHDRAVQVHGGYAFDADYDILSLYQIIRLIRVAPVNNEAVLNFIAQKALKLPRSY